jgi:hypothetical protein
LRLFIFRQAPSPICDSPLGKKHLINVIIIRMLGFCRLPRVCRKFCVEGAQARRKESVVAENLVHLAERFLRLSTELEDTRRLMLSALTNGGGESSTGPFAHAEGRGAKRLRSNHPKVVAAKA